MHKALEAHGFKGEEGYYFVTDDFGNLRRVFVIQFFHFVFKG